MVSPNTALIIFNSAFFAILFMQSGIDKISDWEGNSTYTAKQFANSPLRNFSKPALIILTCLELGCGLTSLLGIVSYLINNHSPVPYYSACLASFTLLCLFFGLRISKDYRGASGLVPYFIASILAIYFAS